MTANCLKKPWPASLPNDPKRNKIFAPTQDIKASLATSALVKTTTLHTSNNVVKKPMKSKKTLAKKHVVGWSNALTHGSIVGGNYS